MSELKLISPMLDGFAVGGAMSSHHGISCYPAMHDESNDKYIVKTISIPASQTQLDALLLSGAYASAQDAQDYFKQVVVSLAAEVKLLDKLSAHHSFLPYASCQIVPMEEGTGYQLYLLSHYRLSLERFLRRNPMTHLAAVNLGIDLCAALEAAREAGHLYVNLKPSNIYRCGEQEYRIGDLGFVEMESLAYCAMPERCVSPYSPPEMTDAFASIGTTADTYALGLVLYQIYNDGQLPFDAQRNSEEDLPSPVHADYEMAEIILKACALDPDRRWKSPKEMGQALITYMQRNEVNNTPIVPPIITGSDFIAQVPSEDLPSDVEEETPVEEIVDSETPAAVTEPAVSDTPVAEVPAEEAPAPEDAESPENPEDAPADTPAPEAPAAWIQHVDELLSDGGDDTEDYEQISIAAILAQDTDEEPPIADTPVTEEVAGMLDLADELIAHQPPAPAVAPEAIDVPMPEPIVLEPEDPEEPEEPEQPQTEEPQDTPDEEISSVDEEAPAEIKPKKRHTGLWVALILVVLLAAAFFAGNYIYKEYYLQEVYSISVDGEKDYMEISVDTEADESLLLLTCTDTYGNTKVANVVNGKARFDDLVPDTHYVISLSISGFHALTGNTECSYGSPSETKIISFSAIAGAEDGSAIVNFTVDGNDTGNWILDYSTDGEEIRSVPCAGHMVTLSGLTFGKEYTFSLRTDDSIYLVGQTQITYVAQKIAYADNLTITGYSAGTVQLSWTPTEGTSPEKWDIHCYHEAGGDIYMTVTECSAAVEGLDPAYAYTIEVTAAGMTQSSRTYLTANPLVITEITADTSDPTKLTISWTYEGNAPEGGWLLLYSFEGGMTQEVVKSDASTVTIDPIVPGATYQLSLQAATGTAIFGGTTSVELPEPGTFSGYATSAYQYVISLCVRPNKTGWSWRDVSEYTSTFSADEEGAMVLRLYSEYNTSQDEIVTTFVTKNSDGNILFVTSQSRRWIAMWYNGRCELDIPKMPDQPGEYTMDMYFNGAFVRTLAFTIE